MKKPFYLLIVIIITILIGLGLSSPTGLSQTIETVTVTPAASETQAPTEISSAEQISTPVVSEPTPAATDIQPTPTLSPTPDIFSTLYGCEMEIRFVSGALESRTTDFSVLGRDYFDDKADKFDAGKGTGIFYEAQRYFILHSAYINSNILRPLEAEFLRKYLENWGNSSNDFIQGQIDALTGSEVLWICDGSTVFNTRINGTVRLSHQASERLWLEPQALENILRDREGLVSEWIGSIEPSNRETIYLGFCGWGPQSTGSARYTYYRYLISFEILP